MLKSLLALVIFLFFNNISLKADDIKDFEIEGMSIGDSLLKYFSKNEISSFANYDEDTDLRFRISEFYETNNFKINNFDVMQVYTKPEDDKLLLYGVRGALFCKNRKQCVKQYKKIINDMNESFSSFNNSVKESFEHPDDKSGKSLVELLFLKLDNGYIVVRHTDWSDKMDFDDNVDVEIATNEVETWLRNNYGKN